MGITSPEGFPDEIPEASEEERRGEVIELWERGITAASVDEEKSLTEAVADLRQRVEERGIRTDHMSDELVEAIIRSVRRVRSMSREEQEQAIYGGPLDEVTDKASYEESKTA